MMAELNIHVSTLRQTLIGMSTHIHKHAHAYTTKRHRCFQRDVSDKQLFIL